MRIHIIILLIVVGLLSTVNSTAQDLIMDNFEVIAQREANAIKSRLQLSSLQSDSIMAIERHFYGSVASLSTGLSPEQRKLQLDILGKEKQQALQRVMTTSQWTQYVQHRDANKIRIQKVIDERRQKRISQQQSGN